MSLLSVYLVVTACANFRDSLVKDPNIEIQKRVTDWLRDSGSLKHKLVMHDPYFAFSTGVDAWDNRVVQYGFSNNDFPEKDLPDSTIFIWDAHFSANEGRLSLEKIIQNPNFEIVKVFDPEVPFKVGVTVIVATIAVVPAFVAVNEETFPEPPATKPIAVLEFVQAKVAPVGVLTKFVAATAIPLTTSKFAGTVTVGTVGVGIGGVEIGV